MRQGELRAVRRRWYAVALAAIAAIAISVQVVRAQIVFPDGSVQASAMGVASAVPPGAAYSRTAWIPAGAAGTRIADDVVPPGMELVIAKVQGVALSYATLESRINGQGAIILGVLAPTTSGNTALHEIYFPDGAVVVGAGRQPWIAFREWSNYAEVANPQTMTITVIGYLRAAT